MVCAPRFGSRFFLTRYRNDAADGARALSRSCVYCSCKFHAVNAIPPTLNPAKRQVRPLHVPGPDAATLLIPCPSASRSARRGAITDRGSPKSMSLAGVAAPSAASAPCFIRSRPHRSPVRARSRSTLRVSFCAPEDLVARLDQPFRLLSRGSPARWTGTKRFSARPTSSPRVGPATPSCEAVDSE
jgi:hypothetical protein